MLAFGGSTHNQHHTSKITVGILTRNSQKTIDKTLNHLSRQTLLSEVSKIIIIDHNSNDNTLNILRRWEKTWPSEAQFQIIENQINHLGMSRNKLARLANTDFLLYLDSDVYLRRFWLQYAREHLMKYKQFAAVSGPSILIPRERHKSEISWVLQKMSKTVLGHFNSSQAKTIHSQMNKVEHLPCSAQLIRTCVIQQVAASEQTGKVGEDLELSFKIRETGWNLGWSNSLYYLHATRANSLNEWCRRIFLLGQGRSFVAKIKPKRFLSYRHLLPLFYLPLGIIGVFFAYQYPYLLIFHAFYFTLILCISIIIAKKWRRSKLMIMAIIGTHISYSLGQWSGLLKSSRVSNGNH